MHIYISHREQDAPLVRELAQRLHEAGFDAWNPYDEVEPGENWSKRAGTALERSDVIVILLTPKARQSEALLRDVQFALASKKHKCRVLSILVGANMAATDVPWILLKLPHVQVDSVRDGVADIVRELQNVMPAASK